jgi:hypothetical protein
MRIITYFSSLILSAVDPEQNIVISNVFPIYMIQFKTAVLYIANKANLPEKKPLFYKIQLKLYVGHDITERQITKTYCRRDTEKDTEGRKSRDTVSLLLEHFTVNRSSARYVCFKFYFLLQSVQLKKRDSRAPLDRTLSVPANLLLKPSSGIFLTVRALPVYTVKGVSRICLKKVAGWIWARLKRHRKF